MVILLDPRSLLPLDVNVEKAFEESGPSYAALAEMWGWWMLVVSLLELDHNFGMIDDG